MPGPTTLTRRQRTGLLRLGDAVVPGDDAMPSFSRSGAAAGIDRILPYLHQGDRDSLLLLFGACAVLPRSAIRGLVALAAGADRFPGPLAAPLRMTNIGIKGVVCSLYYSDIVTGPWQGHVHRVIGWDATIVERETP